MRIRWTFVGLALLATGTAAYAWHDDDIPSAFPQAGWFCSSFEDHLKVGAGTHPDIVLFVEIPGTNTTDRKVCLFVDKRVVVAEIQPAGRK